MNFQCDFSVEPLRVLIINSISLAAKFLAVKVLSGEIFGKNQLIDLVLMTIKPIDQYKMKGLKFELERCAFSCTNTIEVSSNLPSFSDADVFCLLTNFTNPNLIHFAHIDKFKDMLDFIINIASNLFGPEKEDKTDDTIHKPENLKKKPTLLNKTAPKPIFVTDGLIAMNILKSFSSNVPSDIFFCPTPISSIAKSVLGEHLKVQSKVLNNVLVWAANDELFHVEFEKPLIVHDRVSDAAPCDWDAVGKDLLASTTLDHTQFSPSWLKKDLIAKSSSTSQDDSNEPKLDGFTSATYRVPMATFRLHHQISAMTHAITQNNHHGSIYKAAAIAKTLQQIWSTRLTNETVYTNMGVISDGFMESYKGLPYVLPVVFNGDTWRVNNLFEKDIHLKQEFKRMNKAVKEFNEKLILYCKELLLECDDSIMLSVEGEEAQEEEKGSVYSEENHFYSPTTIY